jgi:hypothetical protein
MASKQPRTMLSKQTRPIGAVLRSSPAGRRSRSRQLSASLLCRRRISPLVNAYDWVYSAQWAGIDGNNSNDVLQAGAEVDAYCNGNTTATYYSAWIEWYPFAETQVSSPVLHPGDLVYVQSGALAQRSDTPTFTTSRRKKPRNISLQLPAARPCKAIASNGLLSAQALAPASPV